MSFNFVDTFNIFLRQMLCLIVYMLYTDICYALADVIAMYCCGRWLNIEADVITSITSRWQMLLPFLYFVADGKPQGCNKHGVQVHFKGGNTIKNLQVAPKDKDHILKKSGVIYRYKCDRVECDVEYIGECSRTFGERFKEYQKAHPLYMTIITSLVTKSA